MPLDYFLWGHVKAHVYTDKPASIDALEDNAEMLEKVYQNWTKRINYLRRSHDQHLNKIIIQILNYMDNSIDSNIFPIAIIKTPIVIL